MESKSVRRLNLLLLESRLGSLAEIERATDGEVTASYLSQVKTGYRAMGDKVARKLEERLDLHPRARRVGALLGVHPPGGH